MTQDHLGSPRVITNQNGQVISRKDYMAYGDEVPVTKRTNIAGYDQAQETRKGYTGYEKDVESGLEFAQARYYNARVGRFTSIDPLTASANIKDPQTFNRYTYALNSPYKFTDPLGLISSSTGACGTDCLGTNKTGNLGTEADCVTCTTSARVVYKKQEAQGNNGSGQTSTPNQNNENPTNPNAPVPGSSTLKTASFGDLTTAAADNPIAAAATQILNNTFGEQAGAAYGQMSQYNQAVFLNTVAAIVAGGIDVAKVKFEGFYRPKNGDPNPSGIKLSGISKATLDKAGLNKTGGDVVGLVVRPFMGRRSPGEVKTASLEATVNGDTGIVSFDVDLYNARSGWKNFRRHTAETNFNQGGVTTHPADVTRALVGRGVMINTLVTVSK